MSANTLQTKWRIAAAAGLVGAGLTRPCAAQTLDCPVPQAVNGPGVLKETPLQIAEAGKLLATGDGLNRAPVVIADLRKRYPNVENAEIENYLVTAYCPVAARLGGRSVAERKARLNLFAHQAVIAVYGH